MRRRIVAMCILSVLCLSLIGCQDKSLANSKATPTKENEVKVEGAKYSVWVTYWDLNNLEQELNARENSIDNICYFAAYFDAQEKLFIPQEITDTFAKIKNEYKTDNYRSYLTFVNDLLKTDGSSSLKDTKLLYTLFSSAECMNSHINEIIRMTTEGGFDGIEIDYEGMRSDMTLWKQYVKFIKKLYKAASAKDILVRVVLEPNVLADQLKFCKGPEYVMMCYNLYGYGTEPGPKANQKFLEQLVDKMKAFPGKVNFAFSTGGFDFASDKNTKQISEVEAVTIKNQYGAVTRRDTDSNCNVFSYIDSLGVSHEVWYADQETIAFWYNTIKKYGNYGYSLWRIGGNVINSTP